MHNFRKRSNTPQQAVDGFFANNNQQRPQISDRLHSRQTPNTVGPTTNPVAPRIGDFKRPDGYHPAQNSRSQLGSPATPQRIDQSAPQQKASSILHMTLPSNALDKNDKKRGKKNKFKKSLTKWGRVRKWGLRSGLVVLVILLLVGGFLGTKGYLKMHKVFKGGGTAAALQKNVKPELLKGEGDGRINILLLGKGGDNHDGADLTDTILIASIDPVNKTANMVSIPRDFWVTVSGMGSLKINAVYATAKYRALSQNSSDKAGAEKAGIEAIEATVTDVMGIPIHYYGMVDFKAFQQAVDTVGGVDINIPATGAVADHMYNETTQKPYYLNVPAGQQHFDGLRALMYVRTRHTSLRGDFDRTERQRLFIQALSSKILTAGTYTNPIKVSQLMSAFGDHISTDFNVNDAIRLAKIVKAIGPSNFKSIGLADPPNNYVQADMLSGISIVRPTAGIGDNSEIQNFIRNTLKDPYLAKENAAVVVLNGTSTPGLAGTKSDLLKSFGYNIVKTDTAPTQTYKKTVIVDLTNGQKPYTKSYLEKRLKVTATTKLPDNNISSTGADFVIILGQDATTNSQN
ncbi:MAG TPA: LCP family protein [Patescibacteria group bacterium]|nr:LCP family protein [Patescibacteria group bacterium]